MKMLRKSIGVGVSLFVLVILAITAAYLVYAAFTATKRNLGANTSFNNVTVQGAVYLGNVTTNGYIRLYPNTSPGTCNSGAEGQLYTNTTSHIVYYCNGTSWTQL